jgi:MerR family transcriptional regulator, Zn(II)-responsive regulator of zntA
MKRLSAQLTNSSSRNENKPENWLDPGTNSRLYPDPVSSKDSTTRPLYCGELARLSGVSADTVRFYERRNLLLPAARTSAGYRFFSPDSLARMRMIRAGLSIGFSVPELADIFSERNIGGIPCHRVRKLAAEKLAILEERLRELQSWRRELRPTLAAWDRMLAKTPRGKQARLLENFKTHPKAHARFVGRGIHKRGEP